MQWLLGINRCLRSQMLYICTDTHTRTHPQHCRQPVLCVFVCDGRHLAAALTRRTFTRCILHRSLQSVRCTPQLFISVTDSWETFGLLDMYEGAICQINNSQKQTATGLSDEEAEDGMLGESESNRQVSAVISVSLSFSLIRLLLKQITDVLVFFGEFSPLYLSQ